jgi:hypothetical protein
MLVAGENECNIPQSFPPLLFDSRGFSDKSVEVECILLSATNRPLVVAINQSRLPINAWRRLHVIDSLNKVLPFVTAKSFGCVH